MVRQITKVETAIEPKFQEHFVAANAIPHKTEPFPELCEDRAARPGRVSTLGPSGGSADGGRQAQTAAIGS